MSPSKITAWLACGHYLTLRHQVDAGAPISVNNAFGTFARLIADKGLDHERSYLEALRRAGLSVVEAPARDTATGETFERWAERCQALLLEGHDVIYQLPLVHEGIRGIGDFLVRLEIPSLLGPFSYEPLDAKLARNEAKPGHVLQLCFYAEALSALQGAEPEHVHLYLGSGEQESIRLSAVVAYWRRIRSQLAQALDVMGRGDEAGDGTTVTKAVPCSHCDFCEFADHCNAEWREQDSLHYTAGIRSNEREALEAAGVRTMAALAAHTAPISGLRDERVTILNRQAWLQRAAQPDQAPPTEPLPKLTPSTLADTSQTEEGSDWRARLPQPNDADIIIDYEGHPFWTPARGLFFLFGYLEQDARTREWQYRARWAHSPDEEAQQTADLIEYLAQRRAQHPGMHVYHYNHTERSSLERLACDHRVGEAQLAELVSAGVFVDILDVVRQTLVVGAESYSLKVLERVAGYIRSHEIDQGAGAVVAYDQWCRTQDSVHLAQIARYNEDDVRATLAVRDWLLAGPLLGTAPRPDVDPVDEEEVADDALVAALRNTGEAWKVLLADLLAYWQRERRTYFTQRLALLEGDRDELFQHPEIVSNLTFIGFHPPVGKQRHPRASFTFPPQPLDRRVLGDDQGAFSFPVGDGSHRTVSTSEFDADQGRLIVSWGSGAAEAGVFPQAVVFTKFTSPKPKPGTLAAFAQRVIDGVPHPADPVRIALLRRELPRFGTGATPVNAIGTDVQELMGLVTSLNDSTLAIQGPPGTGKTYTGVRLALALIDAGKKVALTAFSHEAINNFLRELLATRPSVKVLRQNSAPKDESKRLPNTTYNGDRSKWDKGSFDIAAGTTWFFANDKMTADAPFDVLIVDEAGQLGLADSLAALGSARNALLLGDPLQLPQVTQAVHPGGSGASILEHVLGADATIPPDRGAFLDVTYRMHPAVASFISEQIYDGRLRADPTCAGQSVGGETGLRWVQVHHEGCSKSSEAEARAVTNIVHSLIGKAWNDRHGKTTLMTAADVMVVAPYNEHVDLVRETLRSDDATADTRVGTVDKFQGQEAPVVIFTMATSDGEHLPRGADFLFSRNRLNVAISRARALAYVVCTDELLNTRARTVEEMHLIGTLCRFVESATPSAVLAEPFGVSS